MSDEWIRSFTTEYGHELHYVELEDANMFCKCGAKILAYTGELTGYLGSNNHFCCDPNDLSTAHQPISA